MNPALRNVLAVIGGLIIGSIVNMMLVNLGPTLIPVPDGADITTLEGLKQSMHLFGPMNFLFPFLGHAVGTLVGAFLAAKLGASQKRRLALIVAVFFLIGGIANVIMLPSPLWYTVVDLVLAYIPMGLLGARLAKS